MRQVHPKTNGYSNVVRLEELRNRQVDALQRQFDRNQLTAAEQLKLLDSRPGKSARERARLVRPA